MCLECLSMSFVHLTFIKWFKSYCFRSSKLFWMWSFVRWGRASLDKTAKDASTLEFNGVIIQTQSPQPDASCFMMLHDGTMFFHSKPDDALQLVKLSIVWRFSNTRTCRPWAIAWRNPRLELGLLHQDLALNVPRQVCDKNADSVEPWNWKRIPALTHFVQIRSKHIVNSH